MGVPPIGDCCHVCLDPRAGSWSRCAAVRVSPASLVWWRARQPGGDRTKFWCCRAAFPVY